MKRSVLFWAYGGLAFIIYQALAMVYALADYISSNELEAFKIKRGKFFVEGDEVGISVMDVPGFATGLIVGAIIGTIILLLFANRYSHRTTAEFMAFRAPNWTRTWPWVLAYVLSIPVMFYLENNFEVFKSNQMDGIMRSMIEQPIAALLAIGLMAPIFEEFLFRGFFFGILERHLSSIWAVLITSLLFTVIHGQYNVYILSMLFVLALILGFLRQRSGSLWPGVVLHVFNNTMATLAFIQAEGALL